MFSKTRHSDSAPQTPEPTDSSSTLPPALPGELKSSTAPVPVPRKVKPAASVLSSDITIKGNVESSGDIQIEGTVEGDVRAQTLIVGETAMVKGEVIAEEVIAHGRVIGRLRGVKVRLSATARVEGDIVHKAIAIESGAHFEGSVQRQEDPVGQRQQSAPRPNTPAPVAAAG